MIIGRTREAELLGQAEEENGHRTAKTACESEHDADSLWAGPDPEGGRTLRERVRLSCEVFGP